MPRIILAMLVGMCLLACPSPWGNSGFDRELSLPLTHQTRAALVSFDSVSSAGHSTSASRDSLDAETEGCTVEQPSRECAGAASDSTRSTPSKALGNRTATKSNLGTASGPASTSTIPNLKVAFLGDQGFDSNAVAVLQLIKNEGAHMALHQGDFDYQDNPTAWDDRITSILGANFPYFASIGNHDLTKWTSYQQKLAARLARVAGASCAGDLGVKSACRYQGLFFILSGAGTKGTGHDVYIREQLVQDDSIWRVCSWHKNQREMQLGTKSDEVGWEPYEECRIGGAIVATGHEHSYSRTKTLSNTPTQTVDPDWPNPNLLRVVPGATFVFVSGLGGITIGEQERCLPATYPYGCKGEWAKIYTTNQGAQHGALFITFHMDGDPRRALGEFKNIAGETVDTFTILAAGSGPVIASFAPASGLQDSEVTITGQGFTGATTVVFNRSPAAFTVLSDTQIRFTVPPRVTTGKISVTTAEGTAQSATDFYIIDVPTITSFSPESGSEGTQVTLTGEAFVGASEVAFNGIAAAFTLDSNTQVRAKVPTGATSGRVTLTNAEGVAQNATDFTVTPPPPVFTLAPVADAHVRSDKTTSNSGTNTSLRVRKGTKSDPPTYRSYLKFDVSVLTAPVTAAKLRLYVLDDSNDGGSVYSVANTWTELAIIWKNAPPPGTLLASGGLAPPNTFIEIPLPASLFANGNGTFSFVLVSNSSNRVVYWSREGTNPPQLILTTGP